jgi:hypothetical protein
VHVWCFTTVWHRLELFESFDNGQKFFFHRRTVTLRRI